FESQQDLSLLKQALAGGQINMIEYFVELSVVYQSRQNYLLLENQYQKAVARIYKGLL
ncbi:MAG: TolC family protein, partial [Bacteroides sp.]